MKMVFHAWCLFFVYTGAVIAFLKVKSECRFLSLKIMRTFTSLTARIEIFGISVK